MIQSSSGWSFHPRCGAGAHIVGDAGKQLSDFIEGAEWPEQISLDAADDGSGIRFVVVDGRPDGKKPPAVVCVVLEKEKVKFLVEILQEWLADPHKFQPRPDLFPLEESEGISS